MPQIIVTTSFKFAHGGILVEEFDASDTPRETTDEVATWVCENGCGRLVGSAAGGGAVAVQAKAEPAAARSRKAYRAAPENKSSGG